MDTSRDTIGLTELRHLGARWHWFLSAQYEHNQELDLSYRDSALSGLARQMVQTNRNTLTFLGGLAYSLEKYSDTSSSDNVEAGLGAQYEFYKLYTPKMDISAAFLVHPSLTISGRVRTELDVKSRIEIIKDFFWSLSFYDSYDSKPPGDRDAEAGLRHHHGGWLDLRLVAAWTVQTPTLLTPWFGPSNLCGSSGRNRNGDVILALHYGGDDFC